jgi:hypothetical protein
VPCKIVWPEAEGRWVFVQYWHRYPGRQEWNRVSGEAYSFVRRCGLKPGEGIAVVEVPDGSDCDWSCWSLFGDALSTLIGV